MKKSLLTTATLAALSLASTANAASSQRVMFESHGSRLVGDLYLPDTYKAGTKLPAVIVSGAWTTVKEQMPARYAAEMADKGYAALAFDFRNWGQSEGLKRQLEHPELKTQDIVAAAKYLATRTEVDSAKIGGLGICASAGYMADATARSADIRSLALVAPWLHNANIVDAVYGGSESVNALLNASRKADMRFTETGESTLLPAASSTDKTAVMYQAPYYTESHRGLIPEYVNQFNVSSWEPWLTYDAIRISDRLKSTPVTVIHSEAAAIPQGAKLFYERLTGKKSQLWLDNVSQMDFYDQAQPISLAVQAINTHFSATLK